jgi:hypothetical protein
MKSFLSQPFCQRIYLTLDPLAFTRRYNRYAADDEKMLITELEDCVGMAAHLEAKGKSPLFMMYLQSDCDDATLYHESLHLAHYLMDFSGAPISMDSTETQAYLMTHIAAMAKEKLL